MTDPDEPKYSQGEMNSIAFALLGIPGLKNVIIADNELPETDKFPLFPTSGQIVEWIGQLAAVLEKMPLSRSNSN